MGHILLAVLCGIGIGCLSGVLGVGGGTIMVPLFRLGFGMSALAATGTSMFTMIFTSVAGSVSHVRNKTCIVPLALLAGVGGAITSPMGVWLASKSPAWMVMVATALFVAYSSITMIRKGLALPKSGSAKGAQKAANAVEEIPIPQLSRKQYLIGVVAGTVAGLAGGYVGLGGGFLMIPVFISGVGITMRHASGTSLMAIVIIALSAAIAQGTLGNVDIATGLAVAAGSIPAAILSAGLVKRIPERKLRIFFGCFLLFTALALAVNEVFLLA